MITPTEIPRVDRFGGTYGCDRCGGPAQVRVELIGGDFRRHRTVLETVAVLPPMFAF